MKTLKEFLNEAKDSTSQKEVVDFIKKNIPKKFNKGDLTFDVKVGVPGFRESISFKFTNIKRLTGGPMKREAAPIATGLLTTTKGSSNFNEPTIINSIVGSIRSAEIKPPVQIPDFRTQHNTGLDAAKVLINFFKKNEKVFLKEALNPSFFTFSKLVINK